jgi:membrane protease YdiL (CAAX protease family)
MQQEMPLGLAIIVGAAIFGVMHAAGLTVLGVLLMSAFGG